MLNVKYERNYRLTVTKRIATIFVNTNIIKVNVLVASVTLPKIFSPGAGANFVAQLYKDCYE